LINCDLAKELISQDLDEELNSDLNNQLEEHLAECESCTLYRQDLLKLHTGLLKLPEVNLSESIVDILMENNKLTQAKGATTSRFRKLNVWQGLVAAIIIAIVYIPVSGLLNNKQEEYSLESAKMPYGAIEDQQRAGVMNSNDAIVAKSAEDNSVENNSTSLQIQTAQVLEADTQKTDVTANEPDSAIVAEENALVAGTSIDYRVEMIDYQLVIYDNNNNEVFVSTKWDDKFTVDWSIDEGSFINYRLYDVNGQIVKKYRINLIEKKEEIITE